MNVRRLVLLAVPLAFFTVACNKAAVSTNSNTKSPSTAAATPDAFDAARTDDVADEEHEHERYEDEVTLSFELGVRSWEFGVLPTAYCLLHPAYCLLHPVH